MPADSVLRRGVKRLVSPLLNDRVYRVLQCGAKAWDIWRGNDAEPELDLLPLAVRAGESVVDIGANYGQYSYHLSRAVRPRGRVYAFEPVPFTYETCRMVGRLLRFENVELASKGCGEEAGRIAFTIPVQDSGAISAGLAHMSGRHDDRAGKERFSPYPRTTEVWADVVRVDDVVPGGVEISFIKSDVEGADIFALRGAGRILTRDRPTVLCEINRWYLEGFGVKPQAFAELLTDRGYAMYHYDADPPARRLRPVAVDDVAYTSDNYLFVHESRRDRFVSLLGPGLAGG